MNVVPQPESLEQVVSAQSVAPRVSFVRRVVAILLGKAATLVLAAFALVLAIGTFVALASNARANLVFALVVSSLVVVLALGAAVAGRLTRMWAERRAGSAGSRLHVRLVLLFSVVAVTPAIVVAVFASVFFHFGIQGWFSDPIRVALHESLTASRGYLEEHKTNIRLKALSMASDVTRAGDLLADDPQRFEAILVQLTQLRGLTDAAIFEPVTGQVLASALPFAATGFDAPPDWAVAAAGAGEVAVIGDDDSPRVRAVVRLDFTPALILVVSSPVDPQILDHIAHAEQAAAEFEQLYESRGGLQITFALIFGLLALLVLAAAVLTGLLMANQIARPVGRLIAAAERVRAGDLSVRVPEIATRDEVAGLSRAFNRMTGQLAAQRSELMDAYQQIDARRRFTEAVLSGVSAGVIGLDPLGRIELPNRAAAVLLGVDLMAAIGRRLAEVVPEFAPMLAEVQAEPGQPRTGEVQIGPAAQRRTLLVRVGADRSAVAVGEGATRGAGFVATFDDITALQSAQRTAAWADVARRIAHEIKNPLTPIQLAAERLKRRFAKEITSDPETFAQCADTIVRHVGDIGRMVDEFSSFARMPVPVIRREDIAQIVRESLVLQQSARPEITWVTDIPPRGPTVPCDRRQLRQALTNLLQNAADAVAMVRRTDGSAGKIEVVVREGPDEVAISIGDDGVGLPEQDRLRLTEPYVTHKPKGTGLGLAIVKKIMEDHAGRVSLDDRVARADWGGSGAVATLFLPLHGPGFHGPAKMADGS